MRKCPYCGELIGDKVIKCFKCFKDVATDEMRKEIKKEQERVQREREEEQKRKEIEQERKEIEQERNRQRIENNSIYEYAIEKIIDMEDGQSPLSQIEISIMNHAKNGWRLHTIYTNEIGKTSHPMVLRIGTVNATINETIIVYERVIDKRG